MILSAPLSFYVCYLVWLSIFASATRFANKKWILPSVAVIALALVAPFGNTSVFLYLRGVFGDFSVTHALWATATLVNLLAQRTVVAIPVAQKAYLSVVLLMTAGFFYPSALGAVDQDIYRLGFNPDILLPALATFALISWYARQYFALIAISLAVLAWSQQQMESTNLWDYLLDPLLILYSAAWLCATLVLSLRRHLQNEEDNAVERVNTMLAKE